MGVVDLLMRDDVRANVITDYVTVFFRLILIKLREHGHDYEDLRQLSRALGEEDVAKDYRCLWPSRVTIVTLAPEVALCVFFFHFSIPHFSLLFSFFFLSFSDYGSVRCVCALRAVLNMCCLHAMCYLYAVCMLFASVCCLHIACCLCTICILHAVCILSACCVHYMCCLCALFVLSAYYKLSVCCAMSVYCLCFCSLAGNIKVSVNRNIQP